MIWFWTLIGGFRGVLVAVATLCAAYAYNGLIDNPIVVAHARAGFVLQSERDALASQLAETTRQANAAGQAYTELTKRLAAKEIIDAAKAAQQDKEIADYEKKLADAGRACHLDDTDIQWLHDH